MGSHQAPVLRGRLSGEGQVESGHRLGAVGTEQGDPRGVHCVDGSDRDSYERQGEPWIFLSGEMVW